MSTISNPGFQVIDPQSIDDAHLLSTNVVETAPALYAGGTTYALGATVSVATTLNGLDVYTSLQNANVGHAPAGSPTWWKKTGATYGVFDIAHTYAKGDISLDPVGHAIYESQVASNVGHDPTTDDGTHWLKVRASNARAMFDQSNSSQTTNPDQILATVRAAGVVTGVAATNINAATVRVRQIDDVAGVVFDQTINMVSDSGIDDFWPWFFTAPVRKPDLPVVALHPYANTQIEVTLTATGDTAACGALIVGPLTELGGTQWGAQPGFTDYSQVTQNSFGDYDIVKRGWSKLLQAQVFVDTDALDFVLQFFEERRAQPLLFQGDPRWAATIVYGIVATFQPTVTIDGVADCAMTIKGLT